MIVLYVYAFLPFPNIIRLWISDHNIVPPAGTSTWRFIAL